VIDSKDFDRIRRQFPSPPAWPVGLGEYEFTWHRRILEHLENASGKVGTTGKG